MPFQCQISAQIGVSHRLVLQAGKFASC
jgi:hypothetical protein